MHRAFAAWLIAHPWYAAITAAFFAMVSPQGVSPFAVLAGGIPVLMLLGRDARTAMQSVVAACAAATAMLWTAGQSIELIVICVGLLIVAPFALALLLQRTGSLRWPFQVAVIGAGVALIVIYTALPDPVATWRQLLEWAASQVTQAGIVKDEQAVLKSLASTNWGTYVALWLLTVLGSLFIGAWWHSLLHAPGEFGKEFRDLRLGKLLGSSAVVITIAVFALEKLSSGVPLLNALLWIAMVALAFQGLAAAHRLKASGRAGGGWLTATYVLLIVPATTPFIVMLLAGWGVADNWWRRA